MMNGFVIVNKQKGVSSAYVTNKLKHYFSQPCGHMGTLDPLASGVLPIGVGRGSRLFNYMQGKDKTYLAQFEFGYETDTFDLGGKEVKRDEKEVTFDMVKEVLPKFIGEISQVPPTYSAIIICGAKAYDLARRGEEVTLKSRQIKIYGIDLLSQDKRNTFTLRVNCQSGTYIRSLVRDMATALGTCGVMTSLVRERVGEFDLTKAKTLDEILSSCDKEKYLTKIEDVLPFESVTLSGQTLKHVTNGIEKEVELPSGEYKVFSPSEFIGIGRVENGKLKKTTFLR